MAESRLSRGLAAAIVVVLAACAARVAAPPPSDAGRHDGLPEAAYLELRGHGKPVFRVDSARSLVVIDVLRGGSLARFGHDHVVASHDVSGYLAPDQRRADLRVPLATLAVDEPALRSEAGLDTVPSAEDIAGTRSNMLVKVLEVDRYPEALIAVDEIEPGAGTRQLHAAITLHGRTVPVDVVAYVEIGFDEVSVTGTMAFDQSSFGIEPFSIFGGAIAVQDRLTLRFRIHADRVR